jgi:hypothetical protein
LIIWIEKEPLKLKTERFFLDYSSALLALRRLMKAKISMIVMMPADMRQ